MNIRKLTKIIIVLSVILSQFIFETAAYASGINGPLVSTTSLLSSRYRSSNTGIIDNGYIYYIGGDNSSASPQSTVYYAPIKSDNEVGTWNTTTPIGQTLDSTSLAQYNGYIYIVGGNNSGVVTNVYYAKPNADGTITSWSNGTALTTGIDFASAEALNGFLYLIGGFNGTTAVSTVSFVSINGNGSLNSWSTTTSIPSTSDAVATATYNGFIYIIGGSAASSQGATYYTQPNVSTGLITSWTSTNAAPSPYIDRGSAAAYNGFIYLLGGESGSNVSINNISYAPINGGGSLGTWSSSTNKLPQQAIDNTMAISNGYMYDMGGLDRTTTTIYSAVYMSSLRLKILAPVIDEGGDNTVGTSTNFNEHGSIGQNSNLYSTSTHFILRSGFQYYDYGSGTPYMSFSLSNNSINFGTVAVNAFTTATTNATVTTNALYGYNLYVEENANLTSGSHTIPAFIGSSTTNAISWTSGSVNGLGYNVSGSDASSDFVSSSVFRAFDSTASHIIASFYDPTQTTGGDVSTITYQVSVSGTQQAGTYTNNIIYTAIGNY